MSILGSSAVFWATLIVAGFPVAMLALSELRHAADTKDDRLKRLLSLLQNTVLPLAALYAFLLMVVGYERSDTLSKLVETALGIMILNAALALLNMLIFADWSGDNTGPKIPGLMLDLMRLLLVLLGAALIVSTIWGVDLQGLLTALGVGSVVIGLALQDTLSGLFAGIALISGKHFKQGDWLQVGDHVGKVIAMDWRSVTIETEILERVVIPNSELAKQQFAVLSTAEAPFGRELILKFSYQQSPDRIMAAINEAAKDVEEHFISPGFETEMLTFDEYGTSYEFAYFTKDYMASEAARSAFMSRLWFVCQRRGIEIPAKYHQYYRHQSDEYRRGETASARLEMIKTFADFPDSANGLQQLAESAKFQRYQAGESLVEEGEDPLGILLLVSGELRVQYLDHRGARNPVWFDAGSLFTLKDFLADERSPVSIEAVRECEIILISVADHRRFLDQNPDLVQGFVIRVDDIQKTVTGH